MDSSESTIKNNEDNNVYRSGLTKTFIEINNYLGIIRQQSINSEEIYNHIFWSNLSFCCSKNTKKRLIEEKIIKYDIYGEEISNCIDQGYLREIKDTINPELIIFFGSSEKGISHFLSKLFSSVSMNRENTFKKKYTAFRRNGKDVEREFIAVKIENPNCKIISMPHPSYPFRAKNKKLAIKEACNFLLKSDHKLSAPPEPIGRFPI